MSDGTHFADRLAARCDIVGAPVCVGLDPVLERLPAEVRSGVEPTNAHDSAAAIGRFSAGVLESIAPHAACVKLQSACFERYLWPGIRVYHELIHQARLLGLIVIADVKRGDIGVTANHYAAASLADPLFTDWDDLAAPDAVTLSPYLGMDAINPFIDVAAAEGKGVFVLVRTSNPSGDALQTAQLKTGATVSMAVAEMVNDAGRAPACLGSNGYSLLGAVVGATKTAELAGLRRAMPNAIFLVPGIGAQGGSIRDTLACFNPDGFGAVLTASRSVIYAHEQAGATGDWRLAVDRQAAALRGQVRSVLTG